MRDAATNVALAASVTLERLDKYLVVSGGDLDRAFARYERNMRLSEAFYVPLQSLEIALRNHLNLHLSVVYGADWLTTAVAPLDPHSRSMIADAVREIDGIVTPGKIVAELKFAFWVGLVAPRYDATVWRASAHLAFRASGARSRKQVHGRLNALRRFRNRIAHHEPIFHTDVARVHTEVLEAFEWMCAHTRAWTAHHSRVPAILAKPI